MDAELRDRDTVEERRRDLILLGCYFVVCFGSSLRGNEGFMMEAQGMRLYVEKGRNEVANPHVVVPLLGRDRGEVALACDGQCNGVRV